MEDKGHKAAPDVRSLVKRLNQQGKQLLEREIIAPLLPRGKIRTRINGMVHEFKPRGRFVGWGRFRPLNEREAEPLGEALPWERGAYLEQFSALRVILLWPDLDARRPGTWWALPFNESDARQRFGFPAEPLPVFLCDPTNGAERFERVLARVDGRTLWYDGPDTLADPTHAEWLRDTAANIEHLEHFLPGLASSERLALLFWQMRQVEHAMQPASLQQSGDAGEQQGQMLPQDARQQRTWLHQQARQGELENRLRHALQKADATLHSFSEIPATDRAPGYLVVEWSEQGRTRRYRSTIDPRMTVISSGICLSGRDSDFDLTSLVSVMTDSSWSS
ncbi:MAG: hypothetical protein M3Y81_00680 [Chloroflexota bacterium]|nr:hypothetical protein [Chloroflexota bacterium]